MNGQEFEQTLGDTEGQGSLVFWSPRGHKESNTSERLNNNGLAELKLLRSAIYTYDGASDHTKRCLKLSILMTT